MQVDLLMEVSDAGGTVHLLVRVGADGPVAAERNPVNLALVIDRSSSMRGPRIAKAIQAATKLVEQLGERDRLSVIAFDAHARVVFGPATVTDEVKPVLLASIEEIRTGVGTNLAAGIRKGSDAIRSGFVRGAISRLVLLTDGQPSIGICDGERLGALVTKEADRGVTCTTMGLGEGFDDELLAELARRGRGGFHYLADANDIPAAFGRELEGVFSIAATRTELKLIPDDDVLAVEMLHRLDSRPIDDGLLVELGEVASGAPRQVLFKLTRVNEPGSKRCGTLAVSYRNADGSAGDGHLLGIEVPTIPNRDHAREVFLERIRLQVASSVDVAWARRASGDRKQALAALHEIKDEVLAAQLNDRADATALDDLLADIAAAEQAVAKSKSERERARRSMRERSHITLLGHSTIQRLPRDDD